MIGCVSICLQSCCSHSHHMHKKYSEQQLQENIIVVFMKGVSQNIKSSFILYLNVASSFRQCQRALTNMTLLHCCHCCYDTVDLLTNRKCCQCC